jgi:hypothetical protein
MTTTHAFPASRTESIRPSQVGVGCDGARDAELVRLPVMHVHPPVIHPRRAQAPWCRQLPGGPCFLCHCEVPHLHSERHLCSKRRGALCKACSAWFVPIAKASSLLTHLPDPSLEVQDHQRVASPAGLGASKNVHLAIDHLSRVALPNDQLLDLAHQGAPGYPP